MVQPVQAVCIRPQSLLVYTSIHPAVSVRPSFLAALHPEGSYNLSAYPFAEFPKP